MASKSAVRGATKAKVSAAHTVARPRTVVVRRGDTLEEIARRHGVTIQSLRKANRITGSRIQAGQKLKLPA